MFRKLALGLAVALAVSAGGASSALAQVDYGSMSQQQIADAIVSTCSDGGDDCTAMINAILAAAAQAPAATMREMVAGVASAVNQLSTANPAVADAIQGMMASAPSDVASAFQSEMEQSVADIGPGNPLSASEQ